MGDAAGAGPGGRLILSVFGPIERYPGNQALANALDAHLGPEASMAKRTEHALADAEALRALVVSAGFQHVRIRTTTETVRFPSAEDYVRLQLRGHAARHPRRPTATGPAGRPWSAPWCRMSVWPYSPMSETKASPCRKKSTPCWRTANCSCPRCGVAGRAPARPPPLGGAAHLRLALNAVANQPRPRRRRRRRNKRCPTARLLRCGVFWRSCPVARWSESFTER